MSVKLFAVCVLVGLAASLTNAQSIRIGKCDASITPLEDFVAASYTGIWYEYSKSTALFELGGTCITANYTANADGSLGVLNSQLNALTKSYSTIQGVASFTDKSTTAKLSVKFDIVPVAAPYWVLDTDYKNWAAVWSCSDLLGFRSTNMWILVRDPNPSTEVVDQAKAAFEKFGLDTSILNLTDQTDCTYATSA